MSDRLSYEDTTVSVERSISAIRKLCLGHGAERLRFEEFTGQGFEVCMQFPAEAFLGGEKGLRGMPVRVKFGYTGYLAALRKRHPRTSERDLAQRAERVCYRVALDYLKALFVVADYGFLGLAEALLAGMVGPDGRTFGETVAARVLEWRETGGVPGLPPAGEIIDAEFDD